MFSQSLFIQEIRDSFLLDNNIPVASFGVQHHPLTKLIGHFQMTGFRFLTPKTLTQGKQDNPIEI